MDDLLSEFLTETTESLDSLDLEIVRLEQDPNDPELLSNIFRLIHTIKGTCGFLGLPRLETLAHSAENVLGRYRDGDLMVTPDSVSMILQTLDRVKSILGALEETESEPEGDDTDLIAKLDAVYKSTADAPAAEAPAEAPAAEAAPAKSAAADKPLIVRVGGLSAVDAAVELMYRKILKDPDLSPFFEGVDMTILQGRQVEFMTMAMGGPDEYKGGDLAVMHRPLVDRGLTGAHFDKVAEYLRESLVELEIADDVIDDIIELVNSTRDAILGSDGAADPEPAPAEASSAVNESPAHESKTEGPVKESVASQSIRVHVDMLENLMTMVSELVLSRNQLLQILRQYEESEFAAPLQRLNLVTTDLQEGVMKTRMQPIGNAWSKLPRIVRDLALELDKKIDLQMLGADTELDRQVLEMIKDPLTHMVRNSADHGIENRTDRKKAGKSETGKIVLRAYHEGGHIIIEIRDDGRGINTENVRKKILSNGLASETELEAMTEKQIHQFVFKAGFSTAETVTSVSGRGVGMDVVRTNIEKIGGNVELKSETGVGSAFIIKIPLTLAIVSALIVECDSERFAIPQISVDELVRVTGNSEHSIETINETPVLRLRNRLLPLVALDELLELREKSNLTLFVQNSMANTHSSFTVGQKDDGRKAIEAEEAPVVEADVVADSETDAESGDQPVAETGSAPAEAQSSDQVSSESETFIVVTRVGTYSFGIIVDRVFESEEIVVKPVTPILRQIAIFSGNTILGDGSVIMILDPNGIAAASGEVSIAQEQADMGEAAAAHESDDESMTLLMFRAGGTEPKAVPLALVARLEEIEIDKIEVIDGKPVVQYRGQLMPMVKVDDSFKREEEGRQHVVVFTDGDRSMGLMVDEIIDIVEERLTMELTSQHDGIIGTAVIAGKATEIIDTSYYLTNSFGDWFSKGNQSNAENTQKQNRVLLVDDSPFFRNLLTPLLSVAGYRVTAVDGADKALALRDAGRVFDIIISDIEMPGMSGFEFAEEVRKGDNWKDIPLVALSGYSSKQDLDKGREAGFSDYVAKLDRDGLLNSISQTLSGTRGAA